MTSRRGPGPALELIQRSSGAAGSFLEVLVRGSGEEFLQGLVERIRTVLGAELVAVCELVGEDWSRLRSVAVSCATPGHEGLDLRLLGTPFEEVAGQRTRVVSGRLRESYPELSLFTELGIESLASVSLVDEFRRPLGRLCALDTKPLGEPAAVVGLLEEFAGRVSAELEQRRSVEEMRAVVECTAKRSSEDVLRALTKVMARAMHVRTAMVAENLPSNPEKCRIVSASIAGESAEHLEGVEYELKGLPCARVYEQPFVFHPERVKELYDQHQMLVQMNAEAYLAAAAYDDEGRPIGHIALINERPLEGRVVPHELMRILSNRVGAELQRMRAERERRALERNFLETQKRESLAVLAGGVAHDFNNLLMGILGNVSLALRESDKDSASRVYLSEIELASRRAADLARQMLAYSGKGRFVVRDLDLNALVREMIQLLEVSIPKRVTLRFDAEEGLPRVRADATQIRQLVMNLVLNGAEAIGDEDGHVTIVTRSLFAERFDLAQADLGSEISAGNYVCLEVRDDGCGMGEDMRSFVFDPFFSTKFTGRGLGLAAVQGIVRGHEAALKVTSEPGRGSTFEVLMPPARPASTPRDEGEWKGEGLVLVVDDAETVSRTTVRMLERLGFEARVAATEGEALEIFRQSGASIRAVLLDLGMPRGGGRVLTGLREIRPDVTVVLLSGLGGPAAVEALGLDGPVEVLSKPFLLDDLHASLRRALGEA